MSALGNAFGGQSLADRVNAARYALAGQGLARVVCKATTEELLGPKKKHLDYLVQCTHEPNVSIPNMANLLIERAISPSSNWIIVFKSLISMHHLMCYGNERFSQYLASAPDVGLDNLSKNWVDRTSTPGAIEMTIFVRRYAVFVITRISTYRALGYDLSKVKRDSNTIRGLPLERLLELIPKIQGLVDALIGLDAKERDLNNAVIRAAFLILFRDLVRLFASYNDSIICLLEKFFKIEDKKQARVAFSFYMSFAERMCRIALFLKTAEAVGVEKGEIPDLTQAPASIINALEAHCYVLEGKDPSEVLNRPPPVFAPPQPQPPPPPPAPVAPMHPPPPVMMHGGMPPGAAAAAAAAPAPPRPPPAAFNPFLTDTTPAPPPTSVPGMYQPQAPPVIPPQPHVTAAYPPVVPNVYQSHAVPPPPVPPQPQYIPQAQQLPPQVQQVPPQVPVAPAVPQAPQVPVAPTVPQAPQVPVAPAIPPQPTIAAQAPPPATPAVAAAPATEVTAVANQAPPPPPPPPAQVEAPPAPIASSNPFA